VADHYIVVLEDAGANYCAYIPDLPGCVSTGTTIEETVAHIREAMAFIWKRCAAMGKMCHFA